MSYAPKSAPSAIRSDGTLNVNFLERDIVNDVASHGQYRAEDSMKKRAVHSSANYDEFKAFVKCSQLNPVSRSEISQLFHPHVPAVATSNKNTTGNGATTRRSYANSSIPISDPYKSSIYQPSSSSSNIRAEATDTTTPLHSTNEKKNDINNISHPPQNAMEFERKWNTAYGTIPEKAQFLLSEIPPKHLSKLYSKLEMNSIILGEIIECLHFKVSNLNNSTTTEGSTSNSSSSKEIYNWMKMCSRCNRFTINAILLTTVQKDMVKFIIDDFLKLTQSRSTSHRPAISENSLKKLRMQYNLQ